MILKRLELRNFLAFRAPQPISFDGIAIACLSGDNGVGKSSLLDAVTWALWGKARAKRDEDLIHLGQREMRVSLDFEQAGRRYRVTRSRSCSGRGSRGALDLFVFGEAGPRPINAEGLRRTQDKLNAILRLDYETFTHSAFLQQGRADAFALKTPAERKAILADILRLDRWSDYESRVKSELRQYTEQIAILQHDIGRLNDEIAAEPRLKDELASLERAVETAESSLAQVTETHRQVANAARDLQRERENRSSKARTLESLDADIDAAQRELSRLDDRLSQYEAQLADADAIEAGYERLKAARQQQSAIADRLERLQGLDTQAHLLERELARQTAELQRERDVARERIAGLQRQAEAVAETDLADTQSQLQALESLAEERDRTLKQLQGMRERRSGLDAQLAALTSAGVALNERMDRLGAADGETCPLCGQPLTAQHRDEMTRQLETERDAMRQSYRAFSGDIRDLTRQCEASQSEIDGWAQQLKHLPALRERRGALVSQRTQAREAEAALEAQRSELRDIETRLNEARYGEAIRRQLAELADERNQLASEGEEQGANLARLEALDAYDQQQRQLEYARLNLPEAQQSREAANARLDSLHEARRAADAEYGAHRRGDRDAGRRGAARAGDPRRAGTDAAGDASHPRKACHRPARAGCGCGGTRQPGSAAGTAGSGAAGEGGAG